MSLMRGEFYTAEYWRGRAESVAITLRELSDIVYPEEE